MRSIILYFSIAVAVVATPSAHAAGGDARQALLNGARLLEQGDYTGASEWYRTAYRQKSDWTILYNIGQCEAKANHYGPAVEAFEQYLADGGDKIKATQRKEVEAELVQLRSRQAYQDGTTLFEREKYLEAATAFRLAYETNPHWKILYNIAQSEAAAGRHGRAMEAFEQYFALGAENITLERQKLVEAELDRLQRLVGFVDIVAPDGAAIIIDGEQRGQAPLSGRLMVAAGVDHDLKVVSGNSELYRRKVKVSGRQSIAITVNEDDVSRPGDEARVVSENEAPAGTGDRTVTQSTAMPPGENTASTTPVTAPSKLVPTGVVLLITGAAAIAASLVVGGIALKRSNELDEPCENDICPPNLHTKNNSVDNLSLASNVLLFSGAAIVVTGAVLLIVGKKRKKKDRLVQIVPHVHWNSVGVLLGGKF